MKHGPRLWEPNLTEHRTSKIGQYIATYREFIGKYDIVGQNGQRLFSSEAAPNETNMKGEVPETADQFSVGTLSM
jgi:hypothetical protein